MKGFKNMIITPKQLFDLHEDLKKWKADRHLSTEGQRMGLIGNLLEELSEFARAQTPTEQVDALCDMIVFLMNSYDCLVFNDYRNAGHDTITLRPESDCITDLICDTADLHRNLPEKLILILMDNIYALGYSPISAMLETIAEISSRTGQYNESIGKFVKDPGFYSVEEAQKAYPNSVVEDCGDTIEVWESGKECLVFKKWHRADYANCCLSHIYEI